MGAIKSFRWTRTPRATRNSTTIVWGVSWAPPVGPGVFQSFLSMFGRISQILVSHVWTLSNASSWPTISRAFGTLCRLSSVCRLYVCLSVTFCIVVKWYVLAKNFLKERIENQGQKVDFWGVAVIFLLPVSPLWPLRRPFLPYFCLHSPAIGTKWYKLTF